MTTFEKKTVLITGGTSGIGKATALAFAKEGANVVVCGLRVAEGEQVAREIMSTGRRALFVQTDVVREDQIIALIEKTVATFGGLTKASSSCATTVGVPTRLGALAPRRARRKPKTLLQAMSRIVRPPRPVAAHRQNLGGQPVDLPRLRGRDEDSGLHQRGPRLRKNPQASGPTTPMPRAVRRSRNPSTRRSTTTCPPWKRRRCLPALLSAQRALGGSSISLPGARPGHPEAQNAPKPAREALDGVDSRAGICKLRQSWLKVRFRSETKPWKETFCSSGPENQIPKSGIS